MKAFELLEQKGWCQKQAVDFSNGSICAKQALYECYDATNFRKNSALVKQTVGKTVVEWNDEIDNTKEKVIALLKELDI